jgi:ADP-heptose:LPS heptosyltransferase
LTLPSLGEHISGNMKESLLVIHQGALGDVVLGFPTLVTLKEERQASLVLLGHNQIGRLAQGLGIVDRHFRIESARFCGLFAHDLSPEMREFTSQFDGIVVVSFSDDMAKRIRPHHAGQVFTISPRPPVEEETHVALHVAKQLGASGLVNKDRLITAIMSYLANSPPPPGKKEEPLDVPPLAQSTLVGDNSVFPEAHLNGVYTEQKNGLFVIHPGAGSSRKRWGIDNFVTLAEVLKKKDSGDVVFLIGPAEKDLLAVLTPVAAMKGIHVHQVDNLEKVADVIQTSRCFVGNDSGLSHLAGFLGVPTVVVFGPSSTQRWSPLGKALAVLRGVSDCVPCFETEARNCETPRCLDGVTVEMVVEAMMKLGVLL